MGSKRKQSGSVDKNTVEYLEKRMKNNRAVKRSRDKTKAKAQEATTRVQRLQVENEQLRSTVDNMTSELKYLKEMLICQAGTSEYLSPAYEADLEYLLHEDNPTDLDKITNVLTEMRRIQSIQRGGEGLDQDPSGYSHNGGPSGHGQHFQQIHSGHY